MMWQGVSAQQTDYGLPEAIPDGNILHCFSWPIKYVREELPHIAEAGFGAVQLSPLQRWDIKEGQVWYDVYRPHDFRFIESEMGSAADLKALCDEAAVYGIKIIVDVVNNHIDGNADHDSWWDTGDRQRSNPGGISYGSRYSITHDALGGYGDVNSESSEVQERAKAYIEELKGYGVKGIRFDAAKHIGLPSEGCDFWSVVTSVPDMWYYGEILGTPGPDASLITEYAQYISVTDDEYCNKAAKDINNKGLPTNYGGAWDINYGLGGKLVYWGESHDTYCNDAWSKDVDQSVIDRAYSAFACRNGATALYLSRPLGSNANKEIKIGKGSTAFTSKHIAEVNKFRNKMVGRRDYFTNSGNAISVIARRRRSRHCDEREWQCFYCQWWWLLPCRHI